MIGQEWWNQILMMRRDKNEKIYAGYDNKGLYVKVLGHKLRWSGEHWEVVEKL